MLFAIFKAKIYKFFCLRVLMRWKIMHCKYSNFSWWINHYSNEDLKPLFYDSEIQNLTNFKDFLTVKPHKPLSRNLNFANIQTFHDEFIIKAGSGFCTDPLLDNVQNFRRGIWKELSFEFRHNLAFRFIKKCIKSFLAVMTHLLFGQFKRGGNAFPQW